MKQKFWLKLSAILLSGILFLSFSLSWFFSVKQSESFHRHSQIHLTEYFSIIYNSIQSYLNPRSFIFSPSVETLASDKNNHPPGRANPTGISSSTLTNRAMEKTLSAKEDKKLQSIHLQKAASVLSIEESGKPSIAGLQKIVSLYSKPAKSNITSSILQKSSTSPNRSVFLIDHSGMVLAHSEAHYRNKKLSLSSAFRHLVQQYPKGWNLTVEENESLSIITTAQPITFSNKKYFLIASQPARESRFFFLSYIKQALFLSVLTFVFLFLVIFLYLRSFTHAAHFVFRLFGAGSSSVRWNSFLSNDVSSLASSGVPSSVSKNRMEQKKALSYLAHTHNYYLKNMRSALMSILKASQEKTQRQKTSGMEPSFSQMVNKAVCQSYRFYPHLKIQQKLMSDINLPVFEDKLFHSLWELIKNAAQALPANQGGELTIRTFKKHNKWFCCEVEDGGPGMEKEILQKAGTLYFTTKESSTGLGLPFVQSVLSYIGGIVKLQSSSESGGLKVCLFIPLDYIAHVQSLKTSSKETNIECR